MSELDDWIGDGLQMSLTHLVIHTTYHLTIPEIIGRVIITHLLYACIWIYGSIKRPLDTKGPYQPARAPCSENRGSLEYITAFSTAGGGQTSF